MDRVVFQGHVPLKARADHNLCSSPTTAICPTDVFVRFSGVPQQLGSTGFAYHRVIPRGNALRSSCSSLQSSWTRPKPISPWLRNLLATMKQLDTTGYLHRGKDQQKLSRFPLSIQTYTFQVPHRQLQQTSLLQGPAGHFLFSRAKCKWELDVKIFSLWVFIVWYCMRCDPKQQVHYS